MTLSQHLEDIRLGIKAGRYINEAAVSQGVVLRLLQALGWPTFDTQIVCPEFALEGRRVDYALCHPTSKPKAFVEVKQIGQSGGAERQLFEYAFHLGVQLAVLTDGQEWNFFLPAEQGDYAERRVYRLDLLERSTEESAARLLRYLEYEAIFSGNAIDAARQDYQSVSRHRQMLLALPEAWSKLVEEEDSLLLELVADRTESLCGFKPDLDAVAKFLRNVVATRTSFSNSAPLNPIQVKPILKSPDRSTQGSETVGFVLDGKFTACRNGRQVLEGVFEALSNRESDFAERFAARPKHGRTRRYLAKTPEELYPGRPDLAAEHTVKLRSGWFIGTNVSRAQIERIIEMACEVAGVRFGKNLTVKLGE